MNKTAFSVLTKRAVFTLAVGVLAFPGRQAAYFNGESQSSGAIWRKLSDWKVAQFCSWIIRSNELNTCCKLPATVY